MFTSKGLLVTILAAGLALVTLKGACHAIRWSWDYTAYRVKVYMNDGNELGVRDVNNMASEALTKWLEYTGPAPDYPKYELIAKGPMSGYEWPPSLLGPVDGVSNPWEDKLKPGDVIICDDHEGVVQPGGTIAHYLRPVPVWYQYDVRGLPQHWCPDPDKQHDYGASPGWRKDPRYPNDPTKDIMSCCGEFKGDTWEQFLTRSGNLRPPAQCSIYREKDTDKDRVPDWKDKCPNTPQEERIQVDAQGCGPSQRDKDGDEVMDNVDNCPDTDPVWVNPTNLVDKNPASRYYGCAPCEIDEDNDGYKGNGPANCPDKCPRTPSGEAVDTNGCSLRQRITLRIDADDPVEVGGPVRFTVTLEGISESEIPGTWGFQWDGDGGLSSTDRTMRGTVPKDYTGDTLTATVKLVITPSPYQSIELAQKSKPVHVKKARTVKLGAVGPVEDKVGAPVTLQATVDGSPKPPAGRQYGHYWSVNGIPRKSGINMDRYSFSVPRVGLRLVKTVSVLVRESRDNGKTWQDVGKADFDPSPYIVRTALGKVSMKVTCAPPVAPPGTSVQCTANIEDPDALKKLSELASAGGRWGYYWYVNNSVQNSTGASISATIPKTGGTEVVARLMVTDATAGATQTYEADYGGTGPAGPQLQEVGRAGVTLQAQPAGPSTGSTRRKYGPFAVPWGSWFSTGAQIKKGESFSVKATGAYRSVNQNTDVKTCGPDGCGPWRFFVLKAKIGTQMMDVGSSGGGTADQDGMIELGSPRGGTFLKEDAGNCTGSLSAEIWVEQKRK